MKKLLIISISAAIAAFSYAGAANAADMPVKAPVFKAPPAPVIYNWTGFYVGVSGGGGWGHSLHHSTDPTFPFDIADFNLSGGLIGGTVGFNWQGAGSPWVFGVEGDWSWANIKGSGGALPPFNLAYVSETKEKSLATFRGRVGYAWDRWMLFATGGGAAAKVDASEFFGPNPAIGVYDSKTIWGWTVGGGVEAALWGNFSAKAEYLYVDFGKNGFFAPPLTPGNCGCVAADVSVRNHVFRIGLNYHFK